MNILESTRDARESSMNEEREVYVYNSDVIGLSISSWNFSGKFSVYTTTHGFSRESRERNFLFSLSSLSWTIASHHLVTCVLAVSRWKQASFLRFSIFSSSDFYKAHTTGSRKKQVVKSGKFCFRCKNKNSLHY